MKFNDFIKLELKRLFDNLPYKMEAEKSFLDGIKTDTFYHIDSYEDGIESNIFNSESKIDTHMSLFKFDKIKDFKEDLVNFNIKVVLLKKFKFNSVDFEYNMLFLVQKPIIDKVYGSRVKNKLLKNIGKITGNITGDRTILDKYIHDESVVSKIMNDNLLLNPILGDDGVINNLIGGERYKINYTIKGGFSESSEKSKSKKMPKKELKDIVINRCETFDNLYNHESNIFSLKIYKIPEVDLIENIFKIYFISIFKYVLPNLYFNFKNIKKIENINLEYNSIIESNKTLDDSFRTIFFFERDKKLYENMYPMLIPNIPNEISNIDVVFCKTPVDYD